MVDTFLSLVIKKLSDLLVEEANSLKGVHNQIRSLKDELEIIESFLRDAEAKSEGREVSGASKVWLTQLRDEAERIEDVVDEYSYHLEGHRNQSGLVGSLRKAGNCLMSLKPRHEIASEIRGINESLRKIKGRGLSYGLRPFEQGAEGSARVDPRIGSLFVDSDELIGIESASRELLRSLAEGPSTRAVISLVGKGGIGKTTLARKVYNDVTKKGWFDHHVWVTVSQSYNIDKILRMLMDQICPPGRDIIAVEEAFTRLRRSLQAKRYVIVFDDVWQTDFWSVVKRALPNNENSSRILVTTRKSTVIESFRQISCDMIVQVLKTWPTEQAWKLFCKKAFLNSECPPELERLSHEILIKCQGLPLAVVAVAGLLSKKEKTKIEWQRVLKNLNYELGENLSCVSKIILLSYHDLPYHLKLCFLYFGIFPEDFSIFGKRLCRIWIAEGFIEMRKDMELELTAEEYVTELVDRNLVSFGLQSGFERWFKVHDLIREIILTRVSDFHFCLIFNKNRLSYGDKSRRLIIYDTTENVLKSVGDSKICSVFLFNVNELANSFVVGLFKSSKFLKVLDFEDAPLYDLPKEVGNLFHLKYLNLKGTKVKTLPKSIGKLLNLQNLDVRLTLVRELPAEINKLRNLRHVLANDFDMENEYCVSSYIGVRMHQGIGRLEELQSLTTVEAHHGRVNELQKLRKLKCLSISKVDQKMGRALGESLEKMKYLEKLYIISINRDEVLDLTRVSTDPPPPLLRYLNLSFRQQRLPSWISELHNLQSLELNFLRLVGGDPLKDLKGLPNLTFLRMYQAYDGEELHFEKGGFLKLKKLQLRDLERLKMVKIERGALSLLEKLFIGPSPMMKEMPCDIQHLTNLKSLGIYDMPSKFVKALQPDHESSEYRKVQHIPSVKFLYHKGRGNNCGSYKSGSSSLSQHLQENP